MVKLFTRIAAKLRGLGYPEAVGDEPETELSVSLPAELRAFAEAQAAREGFASAELYLRDLVRRAQLENEGYDEALEQLLLEGLDSGPGIEVTPEYWEKKRAELIEKHGGKAAH